MSKTTHTTTKAAKRFKTIKGIDYDAAIAADGLSIFSGRHILPKTKKKKLTYKLPKSLFKKIEIDIPRKNKRVKTTKEKKTVSVIMIKENYHCDKCHKKFKIHIFAGGGSDICLHQCSKIRLNRICKILKCNS